MLIRGLHTTRRFLVPTTPWLALVTLQMKLVPLLFSIVVLTFRELGQLTPTGPARREHGTVMLFP